MSKFRLVMILTIAFALLVEFAELRLCSTKVESIISSGVNVHVDTVLEVNGVAQVPPVFGLT